MPLRLEATTPESIREIVSFLERVFGAQGSPNFRADLLRWKYYERGPAWPGSRSYVLRKDGRIVAHACAWPIRLATPNGEVQAIQMLDWASDPNVAGAGVALSRQLEAFAPVLITCGGSEDTHKILPKIGFTPHEPIANYARVLRPLRQFLTRPSKGIRALGKLARNVTWSMSGIAANRGWSYERTDPDPEVFSTWNARPPSGPTSRYEEPFAKFLLRCPAVRFEYFSLIKRGRRRGFFLLSRVNGQTRLADLRIVANGGEDLSRVYAVAIRAAKADSTACELIATAPAPQIALALEANGFRPRGATPVFVRDPKGLLGDTKRLRLSMLDDDSAFLKFPEHPYST